MIYKIFWKFYIDIVATVSHLTLVKIWISLEKHIGTVNVGVFYGNFENMHLLFCLVPLVFVLC